MKRNTKDVIGMSARRIIKSLIKTNLALLSQIKTSIHSENNINKIYMLMYHRVNDYRNNEMSVPVQEFRRQVAWSDAVAFTGHASPDMGRCNRQLHRREQSARQLVNNHYRAKNAPIIIRVVR